MDLLNNDQTRFISLINSYPDLAHYWQVEGGRVNCSIDEVDDLGSLSSSEQTLMRVLVSIYRGGAGEDFKIDFTDLAAIGEAGRAPLLEWLIAPCWP